MNKHRGLDGEALQVEQSGFDSHEVHQYEGRLLKGEWEIKSVGLDIARRIIEDEHYAKGASNTATYLHGLWRKGSIWEQDCVGVAWWIPPTKSAAFATYSENWQGVLALSRLAIKPDVPKNAATFLMAGSRKLIDRKRWPCLVTYADTWQDHIGTIYDADNWTPVGFTKPEAVWVLNGRMISRKAGPKTRTKSEMEKLGAQMIGRYPKRKYVMCANRPLKRGGNIVLEEMIATSADKAQDGKEGE